MIRLLLMKLFSLTRCEYQQWEVLLDGQGTIRNICSHKPCLQALLKKKASNFVCRDLGPSFSSFWFFDLGPAIWLLPFHLSIPENLSEQHPAWCLSSSKIFNKYLLYLHNGQGSSSEFWKQMGLHSHLVPAQGVFWPVSLCFVDANDSDLSNTTF